MPEQDYELDEISIHAPRVGSDARLDAGFGVGREISIHAPRVGSDVFDVDSHKSLAISIHAPRVGSDRSIYSLFPSGWISIHAPRVGSDLRMLLFGNVIKHFNPRSPCGERLLHCPLKKWIM